MKKKYILTLSFIVLSLVLILLIFPVFIRIDDSVDLGNKYRYIQDYPQSIICYKSDKYGGVGYEVVSPVVLDYDYNKKYIIAKTKDLETKNTFFWIIDKSEGKSDCFLDSIDFNKQLRVRKIKLKLKSN